MYLSTMPPHTCGADGPAERQQEKQPHFSVFRPRSHAPLPAYLVIPHEPGAGRLVVLVVRDRNVIGPRAQQAAPCSCGCQCRCGGLLGPEVREGGGLLLRLLGWWLGAPAGARGGEDGLFFFGAFVCVFRIG